MRQFPGSTCIKEASYDAAREILLVTFRKGNQPPYPFPGVSSEHWEGLKKAKSAGAYFRKHIDRRAA